MAQERQQSAASAASDATMQNRLAVGVRSGSLLELHEKKNSEPGCAIQDLKLPLGTEGRVGELVQERPAPSWKRNWLLASSKYIDLMKHAFTAHDAKKKVLIHRAYITGSCGICQGTYHLRKCRRELL